MPDPALTRTLAELAKQLQALEAEQSRQAGALAEIRRLLSDTQIAVLHVQDRLRAGS